jgi:hypothetical protein
MITELPELHEASCYIIPVPMASACTVLPLILCELHHVDGVFCCLDAPHHFTIQWPGGGFLVKGLPGGAAAKLPLPSNQYPPESSAAAPPTPQLQAFHLGAPRDHELGCVDPN